jgi:hypothetical protein
MPAPTLTNLELKPEELEALQGELLGDGSLLVGARYCNAKFSLQTVYKSQADFTYRALCRLGGGLHTFERDNALSLRRTKYYMFASQRCPALTKIWGEWYPNGRKIVPHNLVLTPRAALHWYIGDGSLHKSQATIVFCTDSFDDKSIDQLRCGLQDNGITTSKRKSQRGHPRIGISGRDVDTFLEWVGPCPVVEHQRKWAVVERKYITKRCTPAERQRAKALREVGLSYAEVAIQIQRNISTVYELINGRSLRRAEMDP